MREILQSPLIGNIIGTISLIVGVIGVLMTIVTMKSAKRIEKQIKKEQIKALDKKRFNECKEMYIKKLERNRKIVSTEKIFSYSLCMDVTSIFNDLQGYKTVITGNDLEVINKECIKMVNMSKALYNQEDGKKSNVDNLQQFDEIVSIVLNILKKGEYSL